MRPWHVAWLSAAALAAACERDAPAVPAVAVARAPAAAQALADTFAPEIVGALVPGTPVAGEYAMALALDFEAYPTTELHVTARRRGALRVTLAADGAARACLGAQADDASQGQWHYEPDPTKRQHSSSSQRQVLALRGGWRVVDGVAEVRFDRLGWAGCDGETAPAPADLAPALRCVAVGRADRLPAGALACTATPPTQLLGLTMPLTRGGRDGMAPPSGADLVLGAPGLQLTVAQPRDAMRPTFTFAAGAVVFDEAAYRPAPPAP